MPIFTHKLKAITLIALAFLVSCSKSPDFLGSGFSTLDCSSDGDKCPSPLGIVGASAHLVSSNSLKWDIAIVPESSYQLRYSLTGDIEIDSETLEPKGGIALPLSPSSSTKIDKFPHLDTFKDFSLNGSSGLEATLAKSQLVVFALNKDGQIFQATKVQKAGFLDENFTFPGHLGVITDSDKTSFRLWSPTSLQVILKIYNHNKKLLSSHPMALKEKGVWAFEGSEKLSSNRLYYRYEIQAYHPSSEQVEVYEVVDPYSVSLSNNGRYSQIVNLSDADLKPTGWDLIKKESIQPADISIYEVHIRDFSINDKSLPDTVRGTYNAFDWEQYQSMGMSHLKSLASSGLSHVQVLPASDFATVEEIKSKQINLSNTVNDLCKIIAVPLNICDEQADSTLQETFENLSKESGEIQYINSFLRDLDGFNWGYDPLVFGTPEGSYSSNPDNTSRILEFRNMVKGLNDIGLKLSLDVVYNHTYSSGLNENSVLDKVVPAYYHRRHPQTGAVETSSCCDNTASEHNMMEHLMIQTLQSWAKDYKVDAFRFDLMGHHMKSNMLAIQKALGPNIYLYGEGWNFGEVANNSRGTNATQLNMAGTGIGSFNDRLRDAVRGGGPFDCGYLLTQQGLGNGLFTNPNEFGGLIEPASENPDCKEKDNWRAVPIEEQIIPYQDLADRLRVGLAGSVKAYEMVDRTGQLKRAEEISYFGAPSAFTDSPVESINYISKHDNQTLWDINQLKLPKSNSMADRVKTQKLGFSINLLAQGIPFFQLGSDILRSKSLNRDSYNSGDWFNYIDYELEGHGWNRGLPRKDKDGQNWELFSEILGAVPDSPSKTHMQDVHSHVKKLLELRYSSPLLRLSTGKQVADKIKFNNTGPTQKLGLISMSLHDNCHSEDLDPDVEEFLILFNVSNHELAWNVSDESYELHPFSTEIRFEEDVLTIPERDLAIMIKRQEIGCP